MESTLKKLALAATLGLALSLTFSCSSDDDDGGGGGSSSSNYTPKSSASTTPSNSCPSGQKYLCVTTYDSKGKKTGEKCGCMNPP